MKRFLKTKTLVVAGAMLAISALTVAQIPGLRDAIKILGVGAVVTKFGPDINKQFNKLQDREDTAKVKSRVVPILSIGIGGGSGGNAIGAAQVMGPPALVDKVSAVAQPEAKLFGEVRIRALIPVSSKDVVKEIRKVDGVAVSGIVDLKL